MAQERQVREIIVRADVKGGETLKQFAKQLGSIQGNTRSLAQNMGLLKNAFLGYFAAAGGREIVNIADNMQLLRDRINVLSGSTEAGGAVFEQLVNRANRTKVAIGDLAGTYARFAGATSDLGVSNKTLLDVVETLQNSFRLSGATAEEAAGSTIQLSQSFSLGKLQGQELRSVMLGNLVVAKLLKEEYGKGLAKAAEQGLITPIKFLQILLKGSQQINTDVAKMGQTFGQTLTIGANKASVAIGELNENLGLSRGFAKAADLVYERIGLIGVAMGLLVASQIPAMVLGIANITKAIYAARAAALSFAASNPLLIVFSLVAIAIVTCFDNLKDFTNFLKTALAGVYEFAASMFDLQSKVYTTLLGYNNFTRNIVAANNAQADSFRDRARSIREAINTDPNDGNMPGQLINERIEAQRLKDLLGAGGGGKEKKIKELYSDLNKQYLALKISAGEYYEQLRKLEALKIEREFRDGKITLDKYIGSLDVLKKQRVDQIFNAGLMTVIDYRNAIRSIDLTELNRKLNEGRISLKQFNEEMLALNDDFNFGAAFQTGTIAYLDSIGTVSQNIANGIQNAFGTLETNFTQFIRTGKFNFAQFTSAILDDIAKIIVRASIVQPLAQALLGGATSTYNLGAGTRYDNFGNNALPSRNGNVFDENGVRKFAQGGIVNRPTNFMFGGGRMGLMGEAGPEAILPLSRSNGKLGVEASVNPVNIQIINNSGAEIEKTETTGPNGEQLIRVIVGKAMNEGLATGQFDKALNSNFGLQRKGV